MNVPLPDRFDDPASDPLDDPLDRLLNDAVDRGLSAAEETELTARLRDDPAARERYRHFMSLHAELHWRAGAGSASLVEPAEEHSAAPPARSTAALAALGALALAVGLLAIAVLPRVWGPDGEALAEAPRTVVTVASVRGAVRYRGPDGGSTPVRLAAALPAGTALVEGASSSVQLQFADGTLVTVGGDAEVEIEERETSAGARQKRLQLRSGLMIAEVRPQPADAPMVIETPAARAEVLGTVFALSAEADSTRLDVEDGLVRLRRLVDGRSVEVPAGRRVVASLDAGRELLPQSPPVVAVGWRHVFDAPPPTRWRGRWLSPDEAAPEGATLGRVRAVPLVVGRIDEDGDGEHDAPMVHFGVTARRTDEADLGTLPRDAVLSAVVRCSRPTSLRIFLSVLKKSGRFGGNFETSVPFDTGTPLPGAAGEAGWRRLTIPIASLHPHTPRHATVPEAGRPLLLMLTSFESQDGLEVAKLTLTTAGETE